MLVLLVLLRGLEGPGYIANAVSHAALLALLVARALASRRRR